MATNGTKVFILTHGFSTSKTISKRLSMEVLYLLLPKLLMMMTKVTTKESTKVEDQKITLHQ